MRAIMLASMAGCYGLVVGECEDTSRLESVSPDGRYAATVIERDCGATTDYSTLVNLRASSKPLDPSPESVIVTMSGKQSFALTWEGGSQQLTITLPRGTTYTQRASWRDVHVAYRHPD